MKKTTITWMSLGACVALGTVPGLLAEEKKRVFEKPNTGEVKTDFTKVPEGWLVGLDRAKKVAEETGKDLLLDFAGSDWIPPSIDLEERVFSKKEFAEAALEHFVLVRLDFPRQLNVQSEELKRKNLEAASHYEVQSYPTVIVADSKGRPYASTGWKAGISVESFLKRLSEMRAAREVRDEHLEKAAAAEGADKVPHLAKFLEGQAPGIILKFYEPEYRELVKWDPEKAGGLGSVVYYEKSLAMRLELDVLAKEGHWDKALEVLDEFGKKHAKTVQQKQQIEFFKLNGLLQLERIDEVMPFLDRVIEMDPVSAVGKKAASVKPELMKRIADALKRKALQEKPKEGGDASGEAKKK